MNAQCADDGENLDPNVENTEVFLNSRSGCVPMTCKSCNLCSCVGHHF
jgi:hypothetical protein